ncbi:TetR/AcrR family transcriptional regulator [Rhodococcus sp. 06-156-3C]|nr:TetR/AcrR family transcriptional regulator [Rhodococcus sp. 06-156-4a]OZD17917.1 TetR/AcrR family transcriptional regulator [Rhodococcus sp. 06-156-3C]OZD20641.1 TetR/AcrR family transcriptional regulator [Rhodococcus sp. 06-156-4C]OZD30641.1 TetR/AcrR family transcriptional regulator [Rhodococcus sp. 06-156-3b]OZD32587.1 TetR/AcrR family transcriptional regulator [Rhodococcus sp. 06-156-3]OZF65003.1 TetR/AcrR family transcriptional regulator [Rhodococcus sp. 06-156-4]
MLRSAASLFREKGVEATSIAEVIAHAGAPRGSVYHHFPEGKPQLAEEATRAAGATMGSMISAGLAAHGPAATISAIVAAFRQQLIATDFRAGCPVAPAALEGINSPAASAAAGESFSSWEDTIAASLWQQGLASERSHRLSTLAISSIEGALLLSKAQGSTRALDRVEAELSSVFADAIGTPGRRGTLQS